MDSYQILRNIRHRGRPSTPGFDHWLALKHGGEHLRRHGEYSLSHGDADRLVEEIKQQWPAEYERAAGVIDDEKPVARASAGQILGTARETIEQRAAERDLSDERSMKRCVEAFNALTGHRLSERDGWLFMVVLKAARATATPNGREDDYVDMAAYAGLAGESAQENTDVP